MLDASPVETMLEMRRRPTATECVMRDCSRATDQERVVSARGARPNEREGLKKIPAAQAPDEKGTHRLSDHLES